MTSKKNVKFSPKAIFINTSYFIKSDNSVFRPRNTQNSNIRAELKDLSDMHITSYVLNPFIAFLKNFDAIENTSCASIFYNNES